ncbi:MAG: Asp-tRNA(Asn)/Glu-tRNA(Gln) amidotransferase subunit GatC [Elusimicrobia bacterium]|jgi:aspartyl-tRNA(Asn)/glutamyl-tRNA(Gln) amidotransferase subunit C|nr:Asp-tRNA(Asn)/Glu-tRNA(Gln) amidotransferase subunit GatC [Elusimicrobiota bacterium]MBK7208055.1 Asp-tRNA(Asn)/Glu-tRNA(Gln) amidotransferase subunit GatC [Elusimicrobiota bacterium]MBK7544833.1 Asp-tRNA(Asn)/Glu-tRNA(Gln) amidotransferase subunit GatC [Elusimicrobiota bacterium]MBK7574345.1 Asp-tRNA(Asn)/Glu-tRNA(Gln) amidotransferase subunit GatC [Elusimicrobiota bacterium]MBK7688291.1 Asp-tRNA(Asn)/Glu-tRNA(Gln) amidotransferase subunit GatC [Elusimicrobiota bacterium]
MSLTEKDVNHVARLARLALTPAERANALGQLGRILEHIQALAKYDVTDVPPTSHVVPLANVWREDKAAAFANPESILANAPDREDVYFKVKKVIE